MAIRFEAAVPRIQVFFNRAGLVLAFGEPSRGT